MFWHFHFILVGKEHKSWCGGGGSQIREGKQDKRIFSPARSFLVKHPCVSLPKLTPKL